MDEPGLSLENAFIHALSDMKSTSVGSGTRIWQFWVVLRGARIGRDCNNCSHIFIENEAMVGDPVTVKCGVQQWNGVSLEDDVFVGPNVTFPNDKYPRSKNKNFSKLLTRVCRGASIDGGATILPGVTIGEGALAGAGAVVVSDVAPHSTVYGNPARSAKQ